MKVHNFVSCVFVLFPILLYSQQYEITFNGSGSATTVDSVKVYNLHQGTSLVMHGNDTLMLSSTVSMYQHKTHKNSLRVFPNPIADRSTLEIVSVEEDNFSIKIIDVSGRLHASSQMNLCAGKHRMEIGGLRAGIYFIIVSNSKLSSVEKIISITKNNIPPFITHSETVKFQHEKHTKAIHLLNYQTGNRLLFTGISGNYARNVTMIATQDETVDFLFLPCTDADNHHYAIVTIGTQTWMAENLKTTKYNDGTSIPYWAGGNGITTPAHTWYNGNPFSGDSLGYISQYGMLYNWYAVDTASNGNKNPCPTGWRIPTNNEWLTLTNYLINNGYNFDGTTSSNKVGKSLAATTTWDNHWTAGNVGTNPHLNNSTGFSGLGAGSRTSTGICEFLGNRTNWWTSTQTTSLNAFRLTIAYNSNLLNNDSFSKVFGHSVRCIRE
jgi:uncharacterized protein (TIGR02145 family)